MLTRRVIELGPLEQAVMDFVWDRGGPVTVREVHGAVGTRRGLAYTTVMTVMDRLWRKRLLQRRRVGRAYLYEPRATREEHAAQLVRKVLAGAKDRRSVLLGFVRSVDEGDLEELERLVREARRARGSDRGR
ncbi:Transcriptional regulator BlaI [bacterium HR12]|nr:Transcriptional regulator BlaI [bacterium HR12]GIU98413.1 MAG: penicillinase repressor [Actinomycetota bacterium]